MSWLSEFLHSPLDYLQENPLKALSLLAAPVAAIAAPFALPAVGSALGGVGAGLGFGGAAVGGAEAAGAGLLGAEAGGWLGAGLGADAAFGSGFAGLGGEAAGLAGGLGGEVAGLGGAGASFGADSALASVLGGDAAAGFGEGALSAFAAEGGSGGMPFLEGNLDWIARMFPGEFGAAAGGEGFGGLPSAFAGGGEAVGGLPGIVTDASMACAPLAVSADAVALGTSGPLEAATPGFWDKLWGGTVNSVMKNPLGTALAAGGLGYSMLNQGTSGNMDAMAGQAAALNAQGQELMKHLQNGTLPPGLDQAVKNATSAMKARIVSNHARNGQSTNPAQNSALAQELNQVDLNAVALIAQQGQQLLTTGMNATNMSGQLYGMLENLDRQASQRTGQAIANFAAALSGPRVNISLGGARA